MKPLKNGSTLSQRSPEAACAHLIPTCWRVSRFSGTTAERRELCVPCVAPCASGHYI
jgi:hypothetical protein